jgi:hypothetical protein
MIESDDKARLQRRHYSKARLKAKVEKVANAIASDFTFGKFHCTDDDVLAALRNIMKAADKSKLTGELENMTIGWLSVHYNESALIALAHDKGVLDDMTRKSKTSNKASKIN